MDRLVWLLERFELRAHVFQAGPLCHVGHFDASDGRSYLHVLRRGRIRVHCPGRRALELASPCVLLFMNPKTHRLTPLCDSVEMVCASFECGIAHGNPLGVALPDMVHVSLAEATSLSRILELLFNEAEEFHCARQAVLDRLSEVVVIHLLRDLMDQGRLQIGLLAGLSDPQLVHAINAMHEHPQRPWTLEQLAHLCGMSRARFAREFRDIVGQTPGTYLSAWRLGLAQALLMKGKPVKVIANEVGYGTASALTRAFTSQLGQSPKAWLRTASGNLNLATHDRAMR